jgi:hypothetical protein
VAVVVVAEHGLQVMAAMVEQAQQLFVIGINNFDIIYFFR